MKDRNPVENQATHGIRLLAYAAALAVPFTMSLPRPARAAAVVPPPVPPGLEVPAGNVAFLEGHGVGTQNYICLPSTASSTGFGWSLFTPEATLLADDRKQITTHFASANPDENGLIRVAWLHSQDTSTVWAKLFHDPVPVGPDAIPWLVLQKVGDRAGPTGDTLTATTFIQRVNTRGGMAPPSAGCSTPKHVGAKAFVPYTADYFFYRHDGD